MTITELLAAMRDRLQRLEIPGLEPDMVFYPAVNGVPGSPCAMLRMRRDQSTAMERTRAAGQMFTVGVEVIVLVAATTNTPRDEARIDPLIHPIIDAFDPDATGEDIGDMLLVDSSEIDHAFTRVVVNRQPVEWAGVPCYAAYIAFDPVIRHRATELPERA